MQARAWWNGRWAMAVAVLAVAVPLLWPRVPPLTDLPSHMASYHVSVNLARSADLQRFYDFGWQLIGNLGVDLAVVPLAHLLGVEAATKLVVILIPVLTALGFLLIARQVHGRLPPTAFAALPLAYNYPLVFGFVNYSLAVALALLGLALWLRWPAERRWPARAASFAAIAAGVWLAHAIGWVMLAVMCGTAELHDRLARHERPWRALVGTALACLPLLAPLLLIALGPHERGTTIDGWFDPFSIAKWLLTVLRDRWMTFDLASAGLIGLLIAAALLRIGGLRLSPRLGWPAAAMLALYVAAPQSINGSGFVSTRIAPYAAALAVLAIDASRLPLRRQQWLAIGAAAFLAVRLAGNTASFLLYDASYTREAQAIEHIPRGAAVLTFSRITCLSGWSNWHTPRLYHLSGLAVVRRDAFVNATWGIEGLHVLRVRYDRAGEFRADPSEMVTDEPCRFSAKYSLAEALAIAPLDAFDHLWLIGVPRPRWPRNPRLVPVWAEGDSVLFRIDRSRTPSPPGETHPPGGHVLRP